MNEDCSSDEQVKVFARKTLSGLVILTKFRMKYRQLGFSTSFKGSWTIEPVNRG